MTYQPEAIAFLLDEDELDHLHPGWPAGFLLAVCLDQAGGCAMLVYHREEQERVLDRVAEAIQQPVGAFCVVPERPGCPTRRILFSEEQRLHALVAEARGLRETAADYAINYSFATEEGLDAELMTLGAKPASSRPAPAAAPVPSPARREEAPARPRAEPRPPARPEARSRPVAETAPEPRRDSLPEGFRVLTEAERRDGVFALGQLSLSRGLVWLGMNGAGDGPGIEVRELYFRDDLLCFVIPLAALFGLDGIPERLAFSARLFPAALLAALERSAQDVRVTAGGAHLYVSLVAPRAPALTAPAREEAAVATATQPVKVQKRPRRMLRTGIGGGMLALAVLAVLRTEIGPGLLAAPADAGSSAFRAEIFAPAAPRP